MEILFMECLSSLEWNPKSSLKFDLKILKLKCKSNKTCQERRFLKISFLVQQ